MRGGGEIQLMLLSLTDTKRSRAGRGHTSRDLTNGKQREHPVLCYRAGGAGARGSFAGIAAGGLYPQRGGGLVDIIRILWDVELFS